MKRTQSLAGYIREHLVELERRLEFGVRQEVIVSELEGLGFATTVEGFRNYLYRARQWAATKAQNQPKEVLHGKPVSSAVESGKSSPPNPLTQSKGFDYKGSADESELI